MKHKIRKLYTPLLAGALCLLLAGGGIRAAASARPLGDVNGDGLVTVSDVVQLRQIISADAAVEEAIFLAADVDGDKRITVSDAVALRQAILNGSTAAPPEEPDSPANPTEGWNTSAKGRYYYKDGAFLTGRQTIGGLRYDFDENGLCLTRAGIDVSTWQTALDWTKLKSQGVEFAFVRLGYRGYGAAGTLRTDDQYDRHMSGAAAAGVDTGVYFFSQATGAAEGAEEAAYVLSHLGSYTISYPIVIDIEYLGISDARAESISKAARTAAAKAFCDAILAAGYWPMIYANPDMCKNGLDLSLLSGYDFWLAHYTEETSFSHPFQVWQYSESGKLDGFPGQADVNLCYRDYPTFLKQNGYNKLS